MPRNPNRLRVGMGHPRAPTPTGARGPGADAPSRNLTPTVSGKGQPPGIGHPGLSEGLRRGNGSSVIPVSIVDAFYQMLPTPDIQQQAIQSEVSFAAFDTNDGLVIGSITTRPQQVYIWTDLTWYAMIPGDGMASPPAQLEMHQLSGLLRFELNIDNRNPMALTTACSSPYIDPLFTNVGAQSGWATMDRDFGSTRFGSAFALYARSQQVTTITMKAVQRERHPRFVLDRIGFEIHGYVAAEADFDEVWRRTVGGRGK